MEYDNLHIDGARVRRWAPWENCTAPSILQFPYLGLPDGLPGTILPTIILIFFLHSFTKLCSVFFLPAITSISERFHSDAVRSTVLAAAATIPELMISVVGTFFAQDDVGVSAILGSAVFNTLFVPGICALVAASRDGGSLKVWALTRDSFMYGLCLLLLAIFFQGDNIYWYEALIMVLLYFCYLAGVMLDKYLRRRTTSFYYSFTNDVLDTSPLLKMGGKKMFGGEPLFFSSCDEAETYEEPFTYYEMEPKKNWYGRVYFGFNWPLHQIMKCSIPCKNPWFSLFSCCIWIGGISYIISWMITIIGYKLRIPDSLMAYTVLGIGVGIPELLISLEAVKRGKGTIALCNALGANIINILICLGVPWLMKMALKKTDQILFNTDGLSYNSALTLIMVLALYIALAINGFVLDRKIGWFLITSYAIFFIMTILIEMNVFFNANLPLCDIKDYFSE